MMQEIERYTGQRIQAMKMPTRADVAARRMALFKESIRKTLAEGDLDLYLTLVEELVEEGLDVAEVAAAAARLARKDKPLEVEVELEPEPREMAQTEDDVVFTERPIPRECLLVAGVDQRPVDVEERCARYEVAAFVFAACCERPRLSPTKSETQPRAVSSRASRTSGSEISPIKSR